jgi:hypothetical protein
MEWPMKRLVLVVFIILVLGALGITGCAEEELPVTPVEGQEIVSSCVSCHSDKELLKQTATVVEEEKSEETSGEG